MEETTAGRPPSWVRDLVEPAAAGYAVSGVLRFVNDDSYAASFGDEWTWFPQTPLDHLQAGHDESRRTFLAKTGLAVSDLEGKTVLDVGCGMGRFTEVASASGARVVGMDLSRAVFSAEANLAHRPNVAIVQGDALDPPFIDASFDVIYSIGVLHHTPDTRRAFLSLVRLLRPGGRMAIWVYSSERRWRWALSDLYRRRTVKMPRERLLAWCRRVEPLGRFYRTRLGRYLHPLLPVSTHPQHDWRVLDTLDWYSPRFQWKHRWTEVEGWFEEAGLGEIRRGSIPVSVWGRAPG
jgi:SAM-dependent methyltransferase